MEKILNFKNLRVQTQKVGALLSSMIMPILGVIIAWGFLTAFFIPTGWTPVKPITDYIVDPTITYLIPLLIGFLGGKRIYKSDKGGFIGAASTIAIIGGAKLMESGYYGIKDAKLGVQFLGAMIVGPLSAFGYKHVEKLWDGKIKPGFEMIVNNFAMAFYIFLAMMISMFVIPWIIFGITYVLNGIIDPLTRWKALPVISLFVEPAKPLFLNNAINHGIFTPIATNQVLDEGKSLLYYIESNPGPGMGILLAYMLIDKKQRANASSSSVIHFFGGIHEVYFPFIILKPILVIAAIAGGVVGVSIMQIFGAGGVSPASPGSIIALFGVSAKTGTAYAGLALGIFSSLIASFVVAVFLLKFTKKNEISREEAIMKMNILKGKDSKYLKTSSTNKIIKQIVFACDAGMGSSAMGVGILKKMFEENNLNIKVTNLAINNLKNIKTDLVIVHKDLAKRAKQENSAHQLIIENFLNKKQYEKLTKEMLEKNNQKTKKFAKGNYKISLIDKLVLFNQKKSSKKEAIDKIGNLLLKNKFIRKEYINAMHLRDKDVSVYIGNNVAIPHGNVESQKYINKSAIAIAIYPNGIKWNSNIVNIVIGIAVKGDVHLETIAKLGSLLSNKENVQKIIKAKNIKELEKIINE